MTQKMLCIEKGFTHGSGFHADDVFSSALLRILNPDIVILRGNVVPEEFDGIVYDIGRGKFDHHQKQKPYRENGIPYAAFGLLWKEFGCLLLSDEDAETFDKEFVQPIDLSDNTGEYHELSRRRSSRGTGCPPRRRRARPPPFPTPWWNRRRASFRNRVGSPRG